MNLFRRISPLQGLNCALRFKLNPTKNTGHSASTHRSNRAKNGKLFSQLLFHFCLNVR